MYQFYQNCPSLSILSRTDDWYNFDIVCFVIIIVWQTTNNDV
jgi:hypothetical protein